MSFMMWKPGLQHVSQEPLGAFNRRNPPHTKPGTGGGKVMMPCVLTYNQELIMH